MRRYVAKMLSKQIIQRSVRLRSSPVVLVRKKDGSWHFCVEYRRLNKITHTKKVYPLPRIDDTLYTIDGAEYFASIELRSVCWQITLDESDCEKIASTPDVLCGFQVMPFGRCSAPATFQRMMDRLLKYLK